MEPASWRAVQQLSDVLASSRATVELHGATGRTGLVKMRLTSRALTFPNTSASLLIFTHIPTQHQHPSLYLKARTGSCFPYRHRVYQGSNLARLLPDEAQVRDVSAPRPITAQGCGLRLQLQNRFSLTLYNRACRRAGSLPLCDHGTDAFDHVHI